MSHFISTLVSISLVSSAFAKTCCYYIEDEATCESLLTAENGPSACEWYSSTSALFIDEIHCRALGWGLCQGANPPDTCTTGPLPPNKVEPDCTDLITEPEGSDSHSVMPTDPHQVQDQIHASETSGCFTYGEKSNPVDCFDPTRNVITYESSATAPNALSFNAKTHNLDDDCCYTYNSVYTEDADCTGKKPEQSHITLMMDCEDDNAWQLTSNNAATTSYGPDGSTCYTGIKFDTGCDDGNCDYTVCVKYADPNVQLECPLADGWIMDKAANTFTFNALIQGVPSCNLPVTTKRKKSRNHALAVTRFKAARAINEAGQTGLRSMFMYVGVFAFVLLCFVIWYWRRNVSYKSIKDAQTDYATFSELYQRV
eukprot:1586_1